MEQYSPDLQPEERELLRISLIISRQADPALVSAEDFAYSEFLGTEIWGSIESYWEKLTHDLDGTVRRLRSQFQTAPPVPAQFSQQPESVGKGFARFSLPDASYGHCEKTLERLINRPGYGEDIWGLGILLRADSPRAYLKRPWTSKPMPSVEWLLEQYAEDFGLPSASFWWDHKTRNRSSSREQA